jgi:ABC-type Fe3+/spermidine/putrescine transport system ATPase subunit
MICDRVGLSFHTRDRKIEALRNLSFQSRPGEFLSIVGPSGAGKTTLLRILAGHLKPDTGIVSCPPTAKNILVRQEGGVPG